MLFCKQTPPTTHRHSTLPMFPLIEPATLGANTSPMVARGRTGSGCRQEKRKSEAKRRDAWPLPTWDQRHPPFLSGCETDTRLYCMTLRVKSNPPPCAADSVFVLEFRIKTRADPSTNWSQPPVTSKQPFTFSTQSLSIKRATCLSDMSGGGAEQREGTVCVCVGCQLEPHQQRREYTVRALARSRLQGGSRKLGSAVGFFIGAARLGGTAAGGNQIRGGEVSGVGQTEATRRRDSCLPNTSQLDIPPTWKRSDRVQKRRTLTAGARSHEIRTCFRRVV